MNKTDSVCLSLLVATSLCGCSMRDSLGAAEVLNHGNCQTLESGIAEVSFDEVAKIRGSKLIDMTVLEEKRRTFAETIGRANWWKVKG